MPFHIFSHEGRLAECDRDRRALEALKAEYGEIRARLEALLGQGLIDEYTKCTIVDMSNRVLESIAAKYKNVKEGVRSVMGGKVLDYEAKRIKSQGWQEGRQEGRLETLVKLVQENLLSVKDAASQAKLTEARFREQMRNYNGL